MTRKEVADYFSVTLVTVKNWEKDGKLTSFLDENQIHWFLKKEIHSFAPEDKKKKVSPAEQEGRIHAQVFALFREGLSHTDIVIRLRIPVSKVRELYEEYNRQLDDVPGMTEEQKLRLREQRLRLEEKKMNIRIREQKELERIHQERMREIERLK